MIERHRAIIHDKPMLLSIAACMLFAVAFSPSQVCAQTVDTQELSAEAKGGSDVDIEADQMQVLQDQNQAVFTGSVDARRGGVRLNSDKLVVHYREKKKTDGSKKTEVTHLDATGSVVIITRRQKITGTWAKMDIKANEVVVGGNVIVHQGKTLMRGNKLYVDLNTNQSRMSGGRVKGSFSPGQ